MTDVRFWCWISSYKRLIGRWGKDIEWGRRWGKWERVGIVRAKFCILRSTFPLCFRVRGTVQVEKGEHLRVLSKIQIAIQVSLAQFGREKLRLYDEIPMSREMIYLPTVHSIYGTNLTNIDTHNARHIWLNRNISSINKKQGAMVQYSQECKY